MVECDELVSACTHIGCWLADVQYHCRVWAVVGWLVSLFVEEVGCLQVLLTTASWWCPSIL